MEVIQEQGRSILVIDDMTDSQNEYMKHMIVENAVAGLLSCKPGLFDNKKVLKYDVTNMMPVRKKYENMEMSSADISSFLVSIAEAFATGRQYLLDESYFLIDPDYIFYDLAANRFLMLYAPYEVNEDKAVNNNNKFRVLSEYLLDKVDHRDSVAVDIVYSLYKMSKESLFSLEAFCSLYCMEKTEKEVPKKVELKNVDVKTDGRETDYSTYIEETEAVKEPKGSKKNAVSWAKPVCFLVAALLLYAASGILLKGNPYSVYLLYLSLVTVSVSVVMIIANLVKLIIKAREDKEIIDVDVNVEEYWYDDGATQFFDDGATVFYDGDGTSLEEVRISWESGNVKKNQVIRKFPCILGKKYEEVDVCISDDSVSRIHASFNMKNNILYLKDLGSTNGTFVDGNRLLKNEEVKVEKGTQIRFGKVDINVV